MPRLDHVIQSENVKIDEPAKKALIELARGDMRKVLNLLQSCSMAFDEIDESKVYQCCGQPLKSDIKAILKALLSYPFNQAYTKVLNLQREKGLALYDIITRVHLLVHKSKRSSFSFFLSCKNQCLHKFVLIFNLLPQLICL